MPNNKGNNKAFKLIKKEHCGQYDFDVELYEHIKSGGRVCFLIRDEANYGFDISFKTTSNNNTGIAHIIEHCVFGGSKKYPLNQLSPALKKYTYLKYENGLTAVDYTSFVGNTLIKKDFEKTLDIFLDAVFNPLFIKEKNVFYREGWRVGLDLNNNKIINGVVYNEMKTVENRNCDKFYKAMYKSLYPNSVYSKSSGGIPCEIIYLKYEDLVKYYKKHYVPNNCQITLCGKMDINKTLDYIDKEYFSKYGKGKKTILPKIKPVIGENIVGYYPSTNPSKSKTYHALVFDFEPKNELDDLLCSLLTYLYLSNPSDALFGDLSKKYGTNFDSSVFHRGNHKFFKIQFESFDSKLYKTFQKDLFLEIKKNLNKIKKDVIIHSINETIDLDRLSFLNKESYCLTFSGTTADNFIHDKSLLYNVEDNKLKQEAIKFIKSHNIKDIIKERILNSKYTAITSIPSIEEHKKIERIKAIATKNCLDKYSKKEIKKITDRFNSYYSKDQTALELKLFPKLKYGDLQFSKYDDLLVDDYYFNKIHFTEHKINYEEFCVIKLYFDLKGLSIEELKYLDIFCCLLFKCNTKLHKSSQLIKKLNKYAIRNFTENLNRSYIKKDDYTNCQFVYFKCKKENIDKLFELYGEVINDTIVDSNTFTNFIKRYIADTRSTVKSKPIQLCIRDAMKSVYKSTYIDTNLDGLDCLFFFEKLEKNYSIEKLRKLFKDLTKKVFNENRLRISVIGNSEAVKKVKSSLPLLRLNKDKYSYKNKIILPKSSSRAFIIDSDVSYNVCCCETEDPDFNVKSYVVCNLLNSYLNKEIREKGGAYGAHADALSIYKTCFYMYSYRDSQVKRTFDIFNSIDKYLMNLKISKDELERVKLSLLNSFIMEKTLEDKCDFYDLSYFMGLTFKERLEYLETVKKNIREFTLEDIKTYAKKLKKLLKNAHYLTIGNENKINEAKNYFDEISRF